MTALFMTPSLQAEQFSVSPRIEQSTTSTTSATSATWDGSVFRIEDAKSRVSIASILLSVSDLKPKEGNLVGEYTIEVPLMKSKNDKGIIVLPLDITMKELGANGGTLRGEAISYKEGTTPNLIVCQVIPAKDQKILLEITTDDRTLEFKSRYTIVEISKGI
jgi:hypothetical protein